MTFVGELIDVAIELLREFGFPLTVQAIGVQTFDANTLTAASPASAPTHALGCFIDPSASKLNGYEMSLAADTTKNRKWMIVQSDVPLVEGSIMTSDAGVQYLIRSKTEIGPTEQTIVYRVG